MDEVSAADWAVRYTQVVAAQVRYYRNLRGVSAQWLSDRSAELGMPIARAVISNMENGKRESISIGEVLCLAKALEVAPIDLLTVQDGKTEVAPGLTLDRVSAAGWIAGTPDPAALSKAAADLARAQDDAERAHRRVEEASRRLGDLLGPDLSAPPLEAFPRAGGSQTSQPNPGTDELRQVAGIREAIGAALEHLDGLDEETMSDNEKTLAAALRQVCAAVQRGEIRG